MKQGPAHAHSGVQAHQLPRRVIIHIDLDCFYCQVEQKRLNIPADVPCAVQQWNGLIAVNYAARAAGITRHMRAHEAKKLCPQLQTVHVQTIGGDTPAAHAEQHDGVASASHDGVASASHAPGSSGTAAAAAAGEGEHGAAAAAAGGGAEEVEGSAADRGSSKASLQRYRKASAEIMRLLAQLAPGCAFEKASIDEAYLDVTALAASEVSQAEAVDGGLPELLRRVSEASIVLGDGGLQADLDYDRLAAAGGSIALRLRGSVYSQLGYTCSAGVGPNKLLAKIASAKNKPNKQTVVLPRAVEGLMQELPLGKVKGLGGKLGAELEALLGPDSPVTAGAAGGLSWEALVGALGGRALWVWETVRGIDSDPVTPKSLVKSINSCKSFESTSDIAVVSRWLAVLAAELVERMVDDEAEHTRRAKTLVLQYRTSYTRNAPDRSVRGPLPRCGRDGYGTQDLTAAGLALFKRIIPAPFPLVRLALAATDFADLPGHSTSGSTAALARFLAAGQQQQQGQHQHQGQEPDAAAGDPVQQDHQAQQHEHGPQAPSVPHHPRTQQQHRQLKQRPGCKQAPGQTRLEQFASSTAAAPPGQTAAAAGGSSQQDQPSGEVASPLQQDQQQAQPPPQQPLKQQAPPQQQHVAQQLLSDPQQLEQPQPQQEAHRAVSPPGPCERDAGPHVMQQQQQLSVVQQQHEELAQLAALAGVDVAGQARILRDIEVQAMRRQRHQQQQPVRGGSSQHAPRKRKGGQQEGDGDSKQMRISSMFGAKK